MRCMKDPMTQWHPFFLSREHLVNSATYVSSFKQLWGDSRCCRFTGIDEKAGCADERDDGRRKVFICLTLGWLACQIESGRVVVVVVVVVFFKIKEGSKREKKLASVVNKHIFMYGFRLPPPPTFPGLINSEKRIQSFFFLLAHTGTHGLAMTFTSFKAKFESRYSTLRWSDMLRRHLHRCHPARQTAGRKRGRKRGRRKSQAMANISLPLYLTTRSRPLSLWRTLKRAKS